MSIILASQSPGGGSCWPRWGSHNLKSSPPWGRRSLPRACPPPSWWRSSHARKRREVAVQAGPDDVVIAADTVVAVDGAVLGKPRDPADAARMLSPALRPGPHSLHRGYGPAGDLQPHRPRGYPGPLPAR